MYSLYYSIFFLHKAHKTIVLLFTSKKIILKQLITDSNKILT